MEGGESRVDPVPGYPLGASPQYPAGGIELPALQDDHRSPVRAPSVSIGTSQEPPLNNHDDTPEGNRGEPSDAGANGDVNEALVGVPHASLVVAVSVAGQLAERLRSLETESRDRVVPDPAELASLRAQLRNLEIVLERARRIVGEATTGGDLESLLRLLNALAQRPTDILVMAKLSEQAGRMVTLAEAFAAVHRLLEAS